ncbi:MAG: DUF4351 domain-containing protein [Acidobacteria bacterium]|nr:DUF4351 domain-containing protein [Acidobacteriota bacterium]
MGQEYDVSLKLLFRRSKGVAIQRLLGGKVTEWLNVELPRVRNRRVDILARTEDGSIASLELQSRNVSAMAHRQASYYLDLHGLLGQHIRQIVLYVGAEPMKMPHTFRTPVLSFRYELVDIRSLDGEALLASKDLGDAMLALLAGVDRERVGQRVWPEIEEMEAGAREDAITELLLISGLRRQEDWVLERVRTLMPLSFDVVMKNKVLGPMVRRKLAEQRQRAMESGREEGLEEGMEKGRQEGELAMLRRYLESRFGPIPTEVEQKLAKASERQLNKLADRAFTASSLDEVFRKN